MKTSIHQTIRAKLNCSRVDKTLGLVYSRNHDNMPHFTSSTRWNETYGTAHIANHSGNKRSPYLPGAGAVPGRVPVGERGADIRSIKRLF